MDYTTKRCSRCKQELPATTEIFYPSKSLPSGLSCRCRTCQQQVMVDFRKSKPEYQQRERTRKSSVDYKRKKNSHESVRRREQLHAENERTSRIRELGRIRQSRRRARKYSLPDTFTPDDWDKCLGYFHGCCAVCERQLSDLFGVREAHADHWIPLTSPNCPGTIPTNIVPLCGGQDGCNHKKHAKDAGEWLAQSFGKAKARKITMRINAYFEWVKSQGEQSPNNVLSLAVVREVMAETAAETWARRAA